MYLGYYSIKRFFFCHFLKNFVIFLILMLFVSFGGGVVVWWFKGLVAENGFEPLTFGL